MNTFLFAVLCAMKDAHRLQSSLIRLSARAECVSPSVDNSGEIERMYNAIEDLYILYIEETLSISAVYTILSSRPQSFLASFSALCTIHRSATLYTPSILIHCFCISPFSPRPELGDRGEGWCWGNWWGGTNPLPSEDSAELSPCPPPQGDGCIC